MDFGSVCCQVIPGMSNAHASSISELFPKRYYVAIQMWYQTGLCILVPPTDYYVNNLMSDFHAIIYLMSQSSQSVLKCCFLEHCIMCYCRSTCLCCNMLTLIEIVRKSWEKDRGFSPVFSRWECFCQNWRIIRQFWQKYSHFEGLGMVFCLFLQFFSWFLSVYSLSNPSSDLLTHKKVVQL